MTAYELHLIATLNLINNNNMSSQEEVNNNTMLTGGEETESLKTNNYDDNEENKVPEEEEEDVFKFDFDDEDDDDAEDNIDGFQLDIDIEDNQFAKESEVAVRDYEKTHDNNSVMEEGEIVEDQLYEEAKAEKAENDLAIDCTHKKGTCMFDSYDNVILMINGNIGSGKTSCIRYLREKNILCCEEPIDEFRKMPTSPSTRPLYLNQPGVSSLPLNILAKLYLHFCNALAILKFLNVNKNSDSPFIVVERMKIYNAFTECLKEQLCSDGWEIAKYLFFQFKRTLLPRVDGVVVFDTPPEVCLKRILSRGRPEEANTPLSFLQRFHEKLFANIKADKERRNPVLVLHNMDRNNEENFEKIKAFVQEIKLRKATERLANV